MAAIFHLVQRLLLQNKTLPFDQKLSPDLVHALLAFERVNRGRQHWLSVLEVESEEGSQWVGAKNAYRIRRSALMLYSALLKLPEQAFCNQNPLMQASLTELLSVEPPFGLAQSYLSDALLDIRLNDFFRSAKALVPDLVHMETQLVTHWTKSSSLVLKPQFQGGRTASHKLELPALSSTSLLSLRKFKDCFEAEGLRAISKISTWPEMAPAFVQQQLLHRFKPRIKALFSGLSAEELSYLKTNWSQFCPA